MIKTGALPRRVRAATYSVMFWERMNGGRGRRLGTLAGAACVALAALGVPAIAQEPASCAKADFEAAVDESAAALRDLNQKNKPTFQERLRQLKDKRGWTHDQFLKEGAGYIKDEQIDTYDKTSNDLLAKISSMGDEGSAAKTPDCALLGELRGHMKTFVDTQTAKWSYMFGKIDGELGK